MKLNKERSNVGLFCFIFLFFIVLSSPVSAEAFKQWESVDIAHPIRVDGAVSTNVIANISVKDPDNIFLVFFAPMTFNSNSQEHNYTLSGSNVSKTGTYTYTITATDGTQNATTDFQFEVTPSGETGLLGFYFLIIILSYGVLIFGVIRKDPTLGTLGSFALFFVGIYVLFNGLDIFKNYLTNGFAIITIGVASYVSVSAAHQFITGAD